MAMVEVKEISERVHNTAGRPIKNASVFYTLYYLSEIKDVVEVSFDLQKITNKLHDGFYYYGLIAFVKELNNAKRNYQIEGHSLKEARYEAIEDHAKMVSEDEPNMVEKIYKTLNREDKLAGGPIILGNKYMEENLKELESKFDTFSDPTRFIKTSRDIFSTENNNNPEVETGWDPAFGGESWAGIAQHMLRRDSLPKLAWVDQSWAIQHNTGSWLNKMTPSQKEQEMVKKFTKKIKTEDLEGARSKKLMGRLGRYKNKRRPHEITMILLEENKEGNMGPVFEAASMYNNELDINLRKYKNKGLI